MTASNKVINFRVTQDERETLLQAAEAEGKVLSDYLRDVLLSDAYKVLETETQTPFNRNLYTARSR